MTGWAPAAPGLRPRPRGRAILTSAPLNGRDVRRKRPPALSFLLRMETLRRVSRVASLLALDGAAVYLAIFSALYLKFIIRGEPGVTRRGRSPTTTSRSSAW